MTESTLPTQGKPVSNRSSNRSSKLEYTDADTRLGKLLFACATVLLLLFSIRVAKQSIPWLLGIVPDDCFYYLKVARNLAQTGISTFDGINPTNGYHPGWMLLMTLCAKVCPSREGLLKACLLTGFAFHFATGLLLIPIFRRLLGQAWAWLGAALWVINAWPLLLALQGVEASFYIFTLTLLVFTYLRQIAPYLHPEHAAPSLPPISALALLGANLGLVMLGRTEGGLLLVTLGVYLLLTAWRTVSPRPTVGYLLSATLAYAGTAFLVFLPWLLFSRWQVGTMTQDSGAMKMLWAAQEHLQPGARLHALGETFAGNWIYVLCQLVTGTGRMPHLVQALLFMVALIPVVRGLRQREATGDDHADAANPRTTPFHTHSFQASPFRALATWLLAGMFISSAVYGLMFTDRQTWYTAQPAISEYIIGFCAIVLTVHGSVRLRSLLPFPRLTALLGLITLVIFARFALKTPQYYRWQPDFYRSEPVFEAQVPVGARIGCFNAGIPAYFGDRTVVNLDGLVNHAVLPYYREHRFDQYLIDQKIDYIADEDSGLERASQFSAAPIVVAGRSSGNNNDSQLSHASVVLQPLDQIPLHNWIAPTRWLWRVEPKQSDKNHLSDNDPLNSKINSKAHSETPGLKE